MIFDEEKVEEIANLDLADATLEKEMLIFLLRISIGEFERFGIEHKLHIVPPLVLTKETEKILSEVYSELQVDFDKINLSGLSNSELKVIVNMFEDILDIRIQKYYFRYLKETILLSLLQFSSVISKLTFSAYEPVDENFQSHNEWDYLTQLWQMFHRDPAMDNRGFIGELKGSLEAAINDLLLSKMQFSNNIRIAPDLKVILVLYHTKVYLWQLKSVIPILFDRRSELRLNSEIGIGIPSYLLEAFSIYQSKLKNVTQRVVNEYSDEIFLRFADHYGFQPDIVWQYLSLSDKERAHKLDGIGVSISPKELLIEDIRLNRKLSRKGAENAVSMFVLNNGNYNQKTPENHHWSSNYRLFRTPLIELEHFYLLPTFTFMETAMYLPKRILTREGGTKGDYEKFIKLNEFDEYDLPRVREHLASYNIGSYINFNLSNIEILKEKIKEEKITKEYDLLYLYQNTLFIWDLKNWGFSFNLYEAKKDIQNINNYKKNKQKKTREFLMKNKDIIEDYLKIEFEEIKMGIITVYPTAYNYINSIPDEFVKSVDEFLEMKFL